MEQEYQELQFEECLAYVGTPEFEEYFFHELAWVHDLDLSGFCQNGGSPKEQPSFDCFHVTKTEDAIVTGRFKVSFTESTGDGCSHVAGRKRRTGEIEFTLCRKTGRVTFQPRPWDQREYEPEEF